MKANPAAATRRTTNAVLIYLIILLSMQVFVITVAVEGFATGDRDLAWASAAISVVLAAGSALTIRFLRH